MKSLLSLLLFIGLAIPAWAQLPPVPAEMARFDVALGNWEGSGTFVTEGGEVPWTAHSTLRKRMGGHIVQSDMVVDIGMPNSMSFRTIYRWDPQAKQFEYYQFDNSGSFMTGPLFWTEDGRMIYQQSIVEGGQTFMDAWVSTYASDHFTISGRRSLNGGPFETHIDGKFTRSEKKLDVAADQGAIGLAPVHDKMSHLEAQHGEWLMEANVSPMPGMGLIPASGKEKIDPILGGHVQRSVIKGDPMPGSPMAYSGEMYTLWDAREDCFKSISYDNFGAFHMSRAWARGNHGLIMTAAAIIYGIPQTQRSIVKLSENQDEMWVRTHRCGADHDPDISFEGTFKRVKN